MGKRCGRPALVWGIRHSALVRLTSSHRMVNTSVRLAPVKSAVSTTARTEGSASSADRLKESRKFLRLHKPIARFLSKHLNASGGILPSMQAPVSSQIEHLPEQGDEPIGAIGRRLPDLCMEAGHIIPVEIREFPCTKDREMSVEHRPIIAAGAFARRMPLQILRGEIAKRGFVQPILSDLRRIVALRDGADVRRRELARLIQGQRPIGPEREAAHPPPNAFFQDERLAPLRDPQPKARQLGIAHKHLARRGKGGLVNELFR